MPVSAGILLQSQGTPLDQCRVNPFVALPTMGSVTREVMDRLPFPPLYPYYSFHPAAVVSQHPVHPMILFHHHMAAFSNYTAAAATSLPDSSFRSSTKTGSIADLRLKARQHLASLGI